VDIRFQQLLGVIKDGSPDDDLAMSVGLLIERHRVIKAMGRDNGVTEGLLPSKLADIHVTDEDVAAAIEVLLQKVSVAPSLGLVWALARSGQPSVVPALVSVLRRMESDSSGQEIAYQALHGITVCGISSEFNSIAIEAIEMAATSSSRIVSDYANEFLEHYRRVRSRG
ncbi:MAG: hypothetical protein WD066_04590, partial [Planctomycetaceae bacterium]